ncbi:MAG: serine hydrolase domain-containing protein [Dehalococcoidia bacterium]
MEPVSYTVPTGAVEGVCDPRFLPVAEAFAANFREREEVGASVSMTVGGETVVDLWGGKIDDDRAWGRDTIALVYSCTKGATALCAHVLASRGQLDVEAPVRDYWPEFARNGKEEATVRMMLDHSAGVPTFHEVLKPKAAHDWEYMCERLEAEEPFWKPGTRNGYHMINFGWTVGELVRRVSGKSLGTFFREAIGEPLGLDFWIGLPEEHDGRVAPSIPYVREKGEPLSAFELAVVEDRSSIPALALKNGGGWNPASREGRAAEIGGGGAFANARSLAGMYAPLACGGSLNGVKLVDETTLARMAQVSTATNEDATLMLPTRFALGFMKSMDNRRAPAGRTDSAILSGRAFGHVGAGGSIGFADPEVGMSFGYAMNRMGKGILMNSRGQSLVDAAYRCLGYGSNDGGVWAR